MNFNIEEIKSAATNGNAKAMNQLSALHLMGGFPGANAHDGIRLLEQLSKPPYNDQTAKLELGLHYYKGEKINRDITKGLDLIEQAMESLGDNVPFEHCFELGSVLATITYDNGEKIPRYQRLSAKLLGKALSDSEGMATLKKHMGSQVEMMIKGLLDSVKDWLSTLEDSVPIMTSVSKEDDFEKALGINTSSRSPTSSVPTVSEAKRKELADARKRIAKYQECISIGGVHTIAGLKTDGTVIAFSAAKESNYYYVENWRDIIAIAAGGSNGNIVGLKSNGTVVATAPSKIDYNNGIDYWEDIIAIATGSNTVFGLKSNGTVVVAGENKDGECDIKNWKNIVAIKCLGGEPFTWAYTVGLKEDGNIVIAGGINKISGSTGSGARRMLDTIEYQENIGSVHEQFKFWAAEDLCRLCGGKWTFFTKKCKLCGYKWKKMQKSIPYSSSYSSHSTKRDDDFAKRLYNNDSDLRNRFDNFK